MNEKHEKGPLTSANQPKRDRWYQYKGANEQAEGDAHFKRLSDRFWGFTR